MDKAQHIFEKLAGVNLDKIKSMYQAGKATAKDLYTHSIKADKGVMKAHNETSKSYQQAAGRIKLKKQIAAGAIGTAAVGTGSALAFKGDDSLNKGAGLREYTASRLEAEGEKKKYQGRETRNNYFTAGVRSIATNLKRPNYIALTSKSQKENAEHYAKSGLKKKAELAFEGLINTYLEN